MHGSKDASAYQTITSYNPSYLQKVETSEVPTKTKEDSYIILGPFQINRENGANVSSIEITDGNTTIEAGDDGGIEYTTINGLPFNDWRATISEINGIDSQTKFYLRIQDLDNTYSGNKWKIKIKSNASDVGQGAVYRGRIICSSSLGDSQNKLIYNAITEPTIVEYDLTVEEPKENTLKVVKYGIGEDGNINNATKQTEVGFIINNPEKGYLKYNGDTQVVKIGKMNYNETDFSWINDEKRNEATIFETVDTKDDGWTGYFQITNMPVGKYHIGEVYNKNKGYENSSISICKLEKTEKDAPTDKPIYDTLISDIQANENISVNIDGVQLLDKIQVVTINLEEDGYTKSLRIYDSKQTNFNIYLDKINTSNTKIGEAEFKIKVLDSNDSVKGWLQKTSDTEYSYDCYYADATTWSSTKSSATKENYVYAGTTGEIVIPNLSTEYKYEIYEFKEGSGCYTLDKQIKRNTANVLASGSMKVKINGSAVNDIVYTEGDTSSNKYVAKHKNIYCGITSYEAHKPSANIVVTNRKKSSSSSGGSSYVDISGIVWLDGRANKSDVYDGKYGTVNDTYLNGVTVYLKNSNTDSVKAWTTTNGSGYYIFSGNSTYLTSSDLENYYIEIAYSGINTSYNIVGYGTGTDESKAKYQNNGFAGTEAINSSYNLHMNIGLKPVSTDTQSVEKWVDNVKVVMKGVPYTYKYGKNNGSVGGGASVGVGNASYYRTIYASDIVYSTQDNVTDGLQIYITYKIRVNNDNKTWQPGNSPSNVGHIQEHYMTVDLKDVYDSTCYELNDRVWTGEEWIVSNWEDEDKDGVAEYNKSINLYNKNYMPSKSDTITVPITFKLTDGQENTDRNALKEILEKGSFTSSNKVEISGQHEYNQYISYKVKEERTGYTSKGIPYTYYVEVIKYKWETKYLSYEEENYAPGMTFSIYEYGKESIVERTISGTVFEDKKLDDDILEEQDRKGEIIGDGLYYSSASNGEGTVQNVTVELLEHGEYKATGKGSSINEIATVAKRYAYYVEEDEEGNKIGVGKVETDSVDTVRNGTYTISGLIPGDYYIRFSYGADKDNDGKGDQVIILKTHNENVTAYDYKSTIISDKTSIGSDRTLQNLIQDDIDGINYKEDSEYYWYRKVLEKEESETDKLIGYSTAVDILKDRENLNNQYSKMYNMRAYTPTFRISLENEIDSSGNIIDEDGNVKEYSYKIENMNFGIIETPEIELGFEKVMTNIRVTNTAGQIIVDGNPVKQEIKYLSNLDEKTTHLTEGTDYAKIEINDEELYGAELEITYAITIINNSDVNYYENSTSSEYGHYYMFGTHTNEANITIKQVYDYLDEKLTLTQKDHGISYQENNELIIDGNWKKIYSQKGTEKDNRFTKDTAIIKATRILANDDADNLEFKNTAKVFKMEVTGKPKLIENLETHQEQKYSNIENVGNVKYTNYFDYTEEGREEPFENPSIQNYLTITPPTGADMNTIMIYIAVIAVAGIIITIGIIVIKKKVLDK